jgi:ABC-type transporter Mla subunit MlaD
MPTQAYLDQLQTLLIPLVIAAAIFLFSLLCFNLWSARLRRLRRALVGLNKQIKQSHASARDTLQYGQNTQNDAAIKFLLRESEAALLELPSSPNNFETQSYSFRPHAETWELRQVVAGRINLSLFEGMPNLLIGFGLMCTFIFLAIALQQAGLALNAMDASARQQDQALQSLIATAGGKFITSIAGLFCSLLWNWRAKIALEKLQDELDTLCHTLRAKIPDNAAEASVKLQMNLMMELLNENRSQVSQLRRFEGDFAQAIANALSRNIQPAFDKIAALSDVLQVSTQSFGSAGSQAAGELSKAGATITQGLEKGLAYFHEATQGLAHTVDAMRGTISELNAATQHTANSTQSGTQQMAQLVQHFGQAIQTIQTTSSGLQQAVTQINQTAQSFHNSTQTIEQAVHLQHKATEDFKQVLVPMQSSISQTVQTLQDGAVTAQQALEHVRNHLQDAQAALTGTVDALTKGVSGYSTQIAELHTKMDQHLATAVNQLSGSITNLEEVLDEFIDALPQRS